LSNAAEDMDRVRTSI